MFSLLKNLLITVVRASSKRGELAIIIEKALFIDMEPKIQESNIPAKYVLPQSPINVLAGCQLKNENANKEPTKGKRE